MDDRTSILSGMSRALHKHCDFKGEIVVVESGKKALGAVGSSIYDICFLDLNLPDMDGLDVMEQIHTLSPKTRVVIMSAEYLDDDIKAKIKNSAFLFIPKPIDLDELKALIDRESSSDADYEYTAGEAADIHRADKRMTARRPDTRTISYSLSVFYNWELKSNLVADIIDISEGGIGMKTWHRLYPGTVVRFDASLQKRAGLVKWSACNEEGCRAGVKFL